MPDGVVSIISYSIGEPELILAPTHALVSFDGDNSNSVVPVKLINGDKVGDKCEVMWPNDRKKYSGTVIALGIH